MSTSKHEYRPEGSDTGAKRMISLCSCGWRGPAVIEGQDFESRELAKRQWWNHVQEAEYARDQTETAISLKIYGDRQ